MEFDKQILNSHGLAVFQIPVNVYLIKKSWNFMIRSWKSDGKVMALCREDFVATLTV